MGLGLCFFLFSFISKRKHFLSTLLSLEGLMLICFFMLRMWASYYSDYRVYILIFLVLVACEGALGLSILIRMVRVYGGDKFNSINFLQC